MQQSYELEAKLSTTRLKRSLLVSLGTALFSFVLFLVSVFSSFSPESVFQKGRVVFGFLFLLITAVVSAVLLFYPLSKKTYKYLHKFILIYWSVYGVVAFAFSFSFPVIIGIGFLLAFLAVYSVTSLLESKFFLLFFFEQWILLFLHCVFRKAFTFEVLMFSLMFAIMCLVLRYSIYRSYLQRHSLLMRVREMTDASEKDPLTGLLNRKGLDHFLASFIPESKKNGSVIGVAVIDIDNFKLYNDSFGHPEGDECLKKVGTAVKASCSGCGEVFRIGGEELLVLFYGKIMSEESYFIKKAVSILKSVSMLSLEHSKKSPIPHVTVSIGLHTCKVDDAFSYESAYKRADKGLYLAKQNGRNGVVCSGRMYRCE